MTVTAENPAGEATVASSHPGLASRAAPRVPGRTPTAFDLRRVRYFANDGARLLDWVDLHIRPGELVAVIGASGAGKSTLLRLLAGDIAPTTGHVHVDGHDAHTLADEASRSVGFVPQDDGSGSLPLATTLQAAARLRLPAGSSTRDARAASLRAMRRVRLDGLDDVAVCRLSGGQRRRASIAVELLTEPNGLLLDEPTSGLDPDAGASIVSELRTLADGGTTVVMTTHHPDDLLAVDRVVALLPGGRICFDGTFDDAVRELGTDDPHRVHRALTLGHVSSPRPIRSGRHAAEAWTSNDDPGASDAPSRIVQWRTLTWRTLLGIRHQRLTAGIMIGAPAAIIAMFTVLFRPGEFGPDGDPAIATMVAFWVAFAGFFFGLTYGLLQICPEIDEMRRERRAGVPPSLQVAAKLTALSPMLLAINTATLAVLVTLERVPLRSVGVMLDVWVTLALASMASLALGLFVSAAVHTPVQTSLALPLLCFPAVLFAGAMVPVTSMTAIARSISAIVHVRWAFEAIHDSLVVADPLHTSPGIHGAIWMTLCAFLAVFTAAATITLSRRLGHVSRLPRRSSNK